MSTYTTAILIAIPIFIILILIEMYIAYKKNIKINRSEDMISSLSSGITNILRDATKFGIVIISYSWLVEQIVIFPIINMWLSIFLAFILQDFAGYWIHRLNHKINIFWNRHLIHHSSEEFNLSCALRQPISNNLKFSAIFLFPAAIFGIPPLLFSLIAPIHLFMQFWYHTQLINKMGFLEKIFVTPSHHRVHHAINKEYLDKNFSQIFIIWDKLFGTFQEEIKSIPPVYGILKPVNTWNPIIINFQHIYQIIKDAYYAEKYIDKLKIWFMPTGWRPIGIEKNYPLNYTINSYNRKKYSPYNSTFKIIWSWVQLILAGFLMLVILFAFNQINIILIFLLSLILILHIMSYTFLLDNNMMALYSEILKIILSFLTLLYWEFIEYDLGILISILIYFYLITSLIMTSFFSTNLKVKSIN